MGDWAFNVDGFPIESNHKMGTGAGTLADLDHDGDTDIIMQFDDSVRVYDTPGVWDADRIDCARWMYDNRIVRDLNDESHAPALAGALHSGRIPLSPQIATDRP
ncbi:MAG: hypothetical protein CME06_11135 [Gemmatimonadetes bacterium]|nr:hypothetical protein [Gemmatimonadota bacterium]